ncbi:polysaccharide biosynthesis tyrosine autokinase [Cellulomonas iranensis]|uniref:polysaccharide biosynthesis tyrosine autokinase n=1 Tax=Cellulomonas iranensis TaxID=76862 RepID=UPI0013D2C785|nr:polysaccharide biosynthesis tyrosine autokinase [Cellulomonas iranensis]
MDLRDYVSVLRKRWVVVALAVAVGLLAALGVNVLTTPVYTAATQLYVSVPAASTTADLLQGSSFTRQQVASYTKLVTTPTVLGPVIDDLALDMRADDLAQRVEVDSPLNSSLINIRVSDESPAVAAALANAISEQFRTVVVDIERPDGGGASTVKLTIVRDAAAPSAPSAPNTRLVLLLGFVGGLVVGVAAALVREVLDTRIRDEAGVAQVTDSAVIGVIVYDEDAASKPLIVQSDPHSPRAEAFRRLRTNVQFLDVADRPSSIVVTSSLPGEGKSTTTINLAIALADAGTRVALVDADLRRPSVARYLGIEGDVGLTTVLIGRATLEDVVQPFGNGFLDVLPAGQIPPNPSELLGSKAMTALLARLVSQYDVVLLDAPPLLPVTDAAVLSRSAGGAIVLVGAGVVTRGQLAESMGALSKVDAHVLGVVVNREPRRQGESSYRYYRYGAPEPVTDRGRAGRRSGGVGSRWPGRQATDGAGGAQGEAPAPSSGAPGPVTAPDPAGGVAVPWEPVLTVDAGAEAEQREVRPHHARRR